MRRTLRQLAAQTLLLDCSQQETFIITFRTSVQNLLVKNVSPGQLYVFVLIQDSTGNHKMNWGDSARNGLQCDPVPHSITVQCFVGMKDGSLQAVPLGTWTEVKP